MIAKAPQQENNNETKQLSIVTILKNTFIVIGLYIFSFFISIFLSNLFNMIETAGIFGFMIFFALLAIIYKKNLFWYISLVNLIIILLKLF